MDYSPDLVHEMDEESFTEVLMKKVFMMASGYL